MIIDYLAQVKAGVAFDLDAIRPGPGKHIKGYTTATATIQHADDNAGAAGTLGALMVVTVGATDPGVEFELPSNTKQWIQSDVAFNIVMDAQTNL